MIFIPLWQRVLVVLAIVGGILFALPNLFYERVERHNDAEARIEAGLSDAQLEADNELEVEIAPNVQVRVVRSTIQTVVSKTEPAKA